VNTSLPDPLLTAGNVLLRPVEPSDYPALRRVELSEQAVLSWRHSGAHPPPEAYSSALWEGVHSHFLAFDTTRNAALGLLTIYDHHPSDQIACFGAFRFESDLTSRIQFVQATYLAMRYAFEACSIRKLYLETPEYNFANLESLVKRGALIIEGRLAEHKLSRGRYWDQLILTATPQTLVQMETIVKLTTRSRHNQ
jgi:RimJ/RimL family protein N-acetyltransferase